MSLQSAKDYFKKWQMDKRIKEFAVSSATVKEAAIAVGCMEAQIAKTLSFLVGNRVVLIVAAGDAKIDNAKYKTYFQTKAKMLKGDCVEDLVGHPIGGVCPFGIKERVEVFLDVSLKRFAVVYPACGSGNSAIDLTIAELEEHSNYSEWIDVCKNWQ